MRSAMNVVCTIDEAYVQPCGTMLCSLFRNNPRTTFRVFVISDGISEGARAQLNQVATEHGQRLDWRRLDATLFTGVPVTHHVSTATYFRILIPRIVPPDVDRVLFL